MCIGRVLFSFYTTSILGPELVSRFYLISSEASKLKTFFYEQQQNIYSKRMLWKSKGQMVLKLGI